MSVSESGGGVRVQYFSGGNGSNTELFAACTECSHLSLVGLCESVTVFRIF